MATAVVAGLLLGGGWLVLSQRASRPQPTPAPGEDRADDDPVKLRSAYQALEDVGLALERHRADRGAFPDELATLVPAYLDALPSDPFHAGHAPLAYRAPPGNAEGRILYSLGPDGVDQGGSPLDPITSVGDLPYPVR